MTREQVEAIIEKYGVEKDGTMSISRPNVMTTGYWKEFCEGLEEHLGINVGYTISFPGVGVLS